MLESFNKLVFDGAYTCFHSFPLTLDLSSQPRGDGAVHSA